MSSKLKFRYFHGLSLTRMVAHHSMDEDKIFERILADNWEAKDR